MQAGIRRPRVRANAFTLLELFVVILVIVCMGAVITPAFTRTAPISAAAQCRNNLRQLGSAWTMYAHDNGGKLVFNHDGGNAGLSLGLESWVAGWLDSVDSNQASNTNTMYLIDHKSYPYGAYLGPYLKAPQWFHCPADHSKARIYNGEFRARVRSYSMNNLVNGRDFDGLSKSQLSTTLAELAHPDRSFTILDEHEDSINDGTFFVALGTPYWIVDFPAARHNGSAGLAFADGHSETHKWQDARTMPIPRGYSIPLNFSIPGDQDVLWLQTHAGTR